MRTPPCRVWTPERHRSLDRLCPVGVLPALFSASQGYLVLDGVERPADIAEHLADLFFTRRNAPFREIDLRVVGKEIEDARPVGVLAATVEGLEMTCPPAWYHSLVYIRRALREGTIRP